ncbi:MAG: malonate decarboxylase holo-[acyl-carrier-protein] synthase [Betaproteobacteria bacterium]|nr:malonate decarboxylase holo-[acyl-carrier-protein] synthase [Betaproteobacteria bacterium]
MRRHDLVYLRRDAAFGTPCAVAGDPFWLAASEWIGRGRPLVAARQPDGAAGVLLGLSLPLAQQRKRLSIQVDRSAVAEIRSPLSIEQCWLRLSPGQANVLRRLATQAAACSVRIGVFGSLAWEVLSGEDYRHAESDIDLIIDVDTMAQLDAMLLALQLAASQLPCRLDGEIRLPDGSAVAWREFAANRDKPTAGVLVKGPREVALLPMQSLLASLDEACSHA